MCVNSDDINAEAESQDQSNDPSEAWNPAYQRIDESNYKSYAQASANADNPGCDKQTRIPTHHVKGLPELKARRECPCTREHHKDGGINQ